MSNVGSAAAGKTLIGAGVGASSTFAEIGTNSGLTDHGVLISQGNDPFVSANPLTSGFVLTSNGGGADPSFQAASASGAVTTVTGNDAVAVSPTAGNIGLVTVDSNITFTGSGSTLTLDFNPGASSNTFIGHTGSTITTGNNNVSLGSGALDSVTGGTSNNCTGVNAGTAIAGGSDNNCYGRNAGAAIVAGGQNLMMGGNAGSPINGSNNVFLGYNTGSSLSGTCSNNIYIGSGVTGSGTISNSIRIGGTHTTAFIDGISGVTVSASAPIGVDTNDQLSSLGFGTATNVFTSNGAGSSPTWQSVVSSKVTTYNQSDSPATWTIDPRTRIVEFYIWSGGGGGGSGRCGVSASSGSGAGGGGSNFLYSTTLASLLTGSPYTVTIGAGGTGGSSINATTTNGNPGLIGGTSSIGSSIVVTGGQGGAGGTSTTSTGGTGAYFNQNYLAAAASGTNGLQNGGGTSSSALYLGWATGGASGAGYTSTTPRTGGSGGDIVDIATTILVAGGTAGSNSGGNGGNGNAPSGLALLVGGTGGGGGGHDGTVTAGSGGNGGTPGGGGGGGAGNLSLNPSGAGGNGGNGRVVIIEFF